MSPQLQVQLESWGCSVARGVRQQVWERGGSKGSHWDAKDSRKKTRLIWDIVVIFTDYF